MRDMDVIEERRMARLVVLNAEPGERNDLEQRHGQVWSNIELNRDFTVVGFMAPFVVVRRKSDGIRGSLEFQHDPRFYFNWREDQ